MHRKGFGPKRRGCLTAVDGRYRRKPTSERPSQIGCFSNRPVGVKHFQTIYQHHSVGVARGLALLFGIGTGAIPPWDSKTRWNNLVIGLAVRRMAGPSNQTNSPHPSSREGHHSTAGWISGPPIALILWNLHAAMAS